MSCVRFRREALDTIRFVTVKPEYFIDPNFYRLEVDPKLAENDQHEIDL